MTCVVSERPAVDNFEQSFCNNLAFQAGTPRDVEAIVRFSSPRHAPARDTLFRQGEPCTHLYLLCAGSIKLLRRHPGGRETIIDFVEPGEIFFEPSLFSASGHPLSAEVLNCSRLLEIRADALLQYLQSHPHLARSFEQAISSKVNALIAHIEQLATFTAEQRIAAFLLEQRRASAAERELLNGRAPRQTDLARMLAVSPETLCRLIGKFKQRGWVSTKKGCIEVRDAASLHTVLGGQVPVQGKQIGARV